MDGKSMKNKTLILVSIKLVYWIALFFFPQNWEHLGGSCITYLNATRHISVCLNIPIYSKTVSALLEWIMDGKSRRWVISYDTIRFCLSPNVFLWDFYNLSRGFWAWVTDELSRVEAHNFHHGQIKSRVYYKKTRNHKFGISMAKTRWYRYPSSAF